MPCECRVNGVHVHAPAVVAMRAWLQACAHSKGVLDGASPQIALPQASVTDVTATAMSKLGKNVAPGDLLVITADGLGGRGKYIFASFHGDTDGLATLPVRVTPCHSRRS